ncbi:SusD/RagB family nutrient-binding outer membrane lipoprotein [Hymenobacter sp. DH14]|uniref:SusD/RagB family nutrient-binding outer membrane lipoprotein n=1 Tax=Hymenobacter cyanobacteriorum TaxID=2926463 RepID=A0A9X1VEB0_9BACT|nr:SusD/RagB family nutrient-binding outer membrane lipoprotein [Hymenobacter cyanobacteriorum]MCI1186528.1 SusD/RagB family nutrient-binding outer membrane lipoprotein [Hymenobacter cyanobacteriorum]
MKKTLLFCSTALFLATSCVDSLKEYNVNPKTATKAPGVTLVANAERTLARNVTSTNVNLNNFRLYVQYWAQTTYFDESIYNLSSRPIPGTFWTAFYRDALADLREARRVIAADPLISESVRKNQLAIADVLEVYGWTTLVDTFGNIPYSKALDISNPLPAYDDAATIYNDLFARLTTDIANMDDSNGSFDGNGELYYHGDVALFKKFANSLKLRMALTIADADAAKAKQYAQEAAPGVFTSNADNAQLNFLSTAPSTNPLWEDLIQSGRYDFVGANTFINRLNALNDPRRSSYFKLAANGTYRGGVYGTNNNYATYSAPGAKLEDPTLPGVLLSYSEVEFLLAESVERGFTVGGTAASHYNSAVTASIQQWGGSAASATTYLAQPSVAYATAGTTGSYKEKIGIQKWIALYGQPVDAWREYRRLDYPVLTAPGQALSVLPLRLTYPVIEQNLNKASYTAASAAIGGDKVSTKIFWDKF